MKVNYKVLIGETMSIDFNTFCDAEKEMRKCRRIHSDETVQLVRILNNNAEQVICVFNSKEDEKKN